MKQHCIVVFVVVFIASCSAQTLADDNPVAVSAIAPAQSQILEQRDCFSGSFADYDVWISRLAAVKENGDRNDYEARFSREDYERFNTDLECRFFIYNVDELLVEGFYVKPRDTGGDRLPVIIYNRGGNGKYGKTTFGALFRRAFPMASSGYVVVGSQYRGSGLRGITGDNGEDEFGGKDVDDVLALFDIIEQLPDADTERVGMLGWSRGGMMTYLAATRTDRLQAIAVGGTPTDLGKELQSRAEMERVFRARIPNYDNNKQAALSARSAQEWPEKIPVELPVLILHGELDDNVTPAAATDMAKLLRDTGRASKLVIYKGGSHGLFEHNDEVLRELTAWFGTYLVN